jgi:hypothetical protein
MRGTLEQEAALTKKMPLVGAEAESAVLPNLLNVEVCHEKLIMEVMSDGRGFQLGAVWQQDAGLCRRRQSWRA